VDELSVSSVNPFSRARAALVSRLSPPSCQPTSRCRPSRRPRRQPPRCRSPWRTSSRRSTATSRPAITPRPSKFRTKVEPSFHSLRVGPNPRLNLTPATDSLQFSRRRRGTRTRCDARWWRTSSPTRPTRRSPRSAPPSASPSTPAITR
jgi:hypothetical protein